jgi:hypothetical protein
MNKETRVQKIQEIIDREKEHPFGIQEIPWQDALVPMNVYKIPLDFLVYNKYNGRILSRTKSLETQGRKIDEATPEGKKIIEKLLWDSKEERNKKTLESLKDFGQEKVGIITRDGTIIDGNRRAMLLSISGKYDYFKAVVLPITLEENPIEIEELETRFQLGEDEKLGYNATEKYLKARELYRRLVGKTEIDLKKLDTSAISKIANWMGETPGEIEKYLRTMAVMDEYLKYLEYDGIYTQLDDREDQFLSLTKWLENFYGLESKRGFDGYRDEDVDDLKVIAFDYLRIRNKYDGKEFRNLAEGNKENHFFGDKSVWKSFSNTHFEIVHNLPSEDPIDYNSNNLKSHLDKREDIFFENSKFGGRESKFLENLNDHRTLVGYNKSADEPEKLIKKATNAFEAIKMGHSSFAKPEVQDLVKELGNKVFASLNQKSPSRVLSHVIELLESINVDEIPDKEIDDVLTKTKKIQQLGYQINKGL